MQLDIQFVAPISIWHITKCRVPELFLPLMFDFWMRVDFRSMLLMYACSLSHTPRLKRMERVIYIHASTVYILKHVKLIYQFKAGNVYRSQPDHRIPGGTMSPSSPSVASWGVGVDDTVLHSLATTGNGRDCTTVLGGFSRGNCIPG